MSIRVSALAAALLSIAAYPGARLLRYEAHGPSSPMVTNLARRGYELFAKGNFAEAEQMDSRGLRDALAVHDIRLAALLANNLGTVRFATFRYAAAIEAFAQARDLARRIGNRSYVSVAILNLSSLYLQVGDLKDATAMAEEALRTSRSFNPGQRAQFLGVLGLVSSASGDSTKAIQYLREAVEAAEMYGDDRVRFEAWSHYAQELFRSGDLDNSEAAALNTYRLGRLPAVSDLRPSYLELARIYRSRGQLSRAAPLIEAGLRVAPRKGDRQLWRMYFLYERAMVRTQENRNAEALSDLGEALSYARVWREGIAPSDSLRSGPEFWLRSVYDAFIDAAVKSGSPEDAFLAVEEERAASLLAMLTSPGSSRRDAAYVEDLARLRAVEIAQLANPAPAGQNSIAQIRQRLSEAEARTGAEFIPASITTQEKIENLSPGYTLGDIQQRVRPDEALISFHLGDSGSYVWALTNRALEVHRLRPRHEVVNLAAGFREAVQQSAPERDSLGLQLYAALFGRLSPQVVAKREWILSSDDKLFEIPFAALVEEKRNGVPVYLLEKHRIRTVPSAQILTAAAAQPAGDEFLAVGDGIYNTADERWKQKTETRSWSRFGSLFNAGKPVMEMPRLASSYLEIRSCARAWNAPITPVLLSGDASTRQAFSAALEKRPAVIHIAAHVLYTEGHADDALIHFGLTSEGSPDVLTTKDVTNLRADGALVVLSGCSSAAGNSIRGSGVMGLTRAWLLAGARAVVGSRWSVPDDTGELFGAFYARLPTARPAPAEIAAALQRAQLQMLRSNTWRSDPKYWGAFYLLAKE